MWRRCGQRGIDVVLASQRLIDAALEARLQPERIDRAVRGLFEDRPASSARAPAATSQMLAAAVPVGLVDRRLCRGPRCNLRRADGADRHPIPVRHAAAAGGAAPGDGRRPASGAPAEWPQAPACPDWLLPVYTVLVPLVREANVLPGPRPHRCAPSTIPPPSSRSFWCWRLPTPRRRRPCWAWSCPATSAPLVVPDRAPHTKPKALNYALQFARGDFVVVYDAEDRPQPDQLRRAWEVFRHAPPELGCLQAQLNIYNPRQSWLTRQFTIEYSALFDAILPALERLRLPVPLGGTSNHFPRATLISVGAWDPYNVTEDADLGIRLARQGYRTGVLGSTTWEEAPPVFGIWIKQRTRWLKGWMQTYLVHTRDLRRLNRDLGLACGDRLSCADGRAHRLGARSPAVLRAAARPLAGGRPAGAGRDVGRAGGVDHRLDQSRHLLRRLDSGRHPQRVAPRPAGARHVRAADAALLAARSRSPPTAPSTSSRATPTSGRRPRTAPANPAAGGARPHRSSSRAKAMQSSRADFFRQTV